MVVCHFPFLLPRAVAFEADIRTALRFTGEAAFTVFLRGVAGCLAAEGAGVASPVLTAILPSVDPIA